jgi:hypothetical protein
MYRRKEVIMEERKEGKTESQVDGSGMADFLIEKQVTPDLFLAFWEQVGSKHRNEDGQSDVFRVITTPHPIIKALTTSTSLRTTFAPGPEISQIRCVLAGKVRVLNLGGTPEELRAFADKLTARNAALGLIVPEAKEGGAAVPILDGSFNIAGGYVRPIFGLSELKKDLPLLLEFHEPQTPLNWAVGLAMFSLTNEDRVRSGDWQEATIRDLEDRVFCLTERNAPRRGDHREDILAEVVKLATTHNWYYTIETLRVGRAWKKRATIGVKTAVPELDFIFLDMATGKRAFPSDPSLRDFKIPLEVKGRRITRPDGKDFVALPKGRWKLESIRWRWVQSFNDDLLLKPALVESGRRKGLSMKTTTGKTIRKGYLIKVADNVFHALGRLRAEGRGSLYACRLLIMLASNLNKTESGIYADRVFRMLGIPEDYQERTHEKPEELVARAVLRLKERDVRALLAGSDEYPRTDPNPDRRKGPYYCFKRSPEYTPRTGIVSKESALAIEAEYESSIPPALPDLKTRADQIALPGIMEDALPIPSGSSIRAAREAAGLNLRRFAEVIGGPSFKTWSMIETGQRSESAGRIKPEVWQKVRDFISQHGKKEG